ncbi:MAG: molybdenum cofactor guanylyltransferase [Chloroflexi bacterium]|nr:molybdenum cofactor guanylyltransferase [Chloroflexota bacterium]
MTDDGLQLDRVTGIVLAGGRASRFGSDKLAAHLDGRPILHHALAALGQVAAGLVVVVAPAADPVLPAQIAGRIRILHDDEAYGGPLVGLAAALEAVTTPLAIVVGGDMPRLVPAVLRRLAKEVGEGCLAVTLEVPGRVQPLPMAVDTAAARAAARVVLVRGGRSLGGLLDEMGATSIPASDWLALDPAGATITDIDRPADLGR